MSFIYIIVDETSAQVENFGFRLCKCFKKNTPFLKGKNLAATVNACSFLFAFEKTICKTFAKYLFPTEHLQWHDIT